MVWRYEKIRMASTSTTVNVIGTTSVKARMPTAGTRMRRISSVAYATEDMLSEENTARAVGLPSRSCSSRAVASGLPRNSRLRRYAEAGSGRAADEPTACLVATIASSIGTGAQRGRQERRRWRQHGGKTGTDQ